MKVKPGGQRSAKPLSDKARRDGAHSKGSGAECNADVDNLESSADEPQDQLAVKNRQARGNQSRTEDSGADPSSTESTLYSSDFSALQTRKQKQIPPGQLKKTAQHGENGETETRTANAAISDVPGQTHATETKPAAVDDGANSNAGGEISRVAGQQAVQYKEESHTKPVAEGKDQHMHTAAPSHSESAIAESKPGRRDSLPPGQQKKLQQPMHSGQQSHVESASQSSVNPQTYVPLVSDTRTATTPVYQASYQWVRIPYPLSSFIPPATPSIPSPSAEPSGSTTTVVLPGEKVPVGHNKNSEEDNAKFAGYGYSGFGLSALRESNVEVLNEAADAIWKHSKTTSGTRSDSDDL